MKNADIQINHLLYQALGFMRKGYIMKTKMHKMSGPFLINMPE